MNDKVYEWQWIIKVNDMYEMTNYYTEKEIKKHHSRYRKYDPSIRVRK